MNKIEKLRQERKEVIKEYSVKNNFVISTGGGCIKRKQSNSFNFSNCY